MLGRPSISLASLGEKAKPRSGHSLAPSIAESLTQAPLQMDAKAFGKMTRGKLAPEARIDLHGMTLAEAHPELVRFILNCQSAGMRLVLVITGKGKRGEDKRPIYVECTWNKLIFHPDRFAGALPMCGVLSGGVEVSFSSAASQELSNR